MDLGVLLAEHQEYMVERNEELAKQGILVFKLSTTERQEFKRCRRRWDYSSMSRQGIEPKRPHMALWTGIGMHYALERFYGHGENIRAVWDWYADTEIERCRKEQHGLWPEQVQELEATSSLIGQVLENYVVWAQKADARDFKDLFTVEQEFEVCILDANGMPLRFTDANGQVWECHLVGRLDMLVGDWDGRYWLLDHKSSKDKLDTETLIMDDQMTVYLWAAQQIFKVAFEGAYYNCIRKKLPTVPKVLASGKALSKDKSIDTTYDVYLQAILDCKFNPDDYADILGLLANTPNTFFQREKVRRNQHEILMAGYLLQFEAIDMLNQPYIYPNPTRDCKWDCDYKELCLATNRNDDVKWLLGSCYQKRKPKESSVYNRETTIA